MRSPGFLTEKDSITMTEPYHVAQQMILLDRTEALFHGFADQLLELESGVSPE